MSALHLRGMGLIRVESGAQVLVWEERAKKWCREIFSNSPQSNSTESKDRGNHYAAVMIMVEDGLCPLSCLWEAAPGFIHL